MVIISMILPTVFNTNLIYKIMYFTKSIELSTKWLLNKFDKHKIFGIFLSR